MNSIKNAIVTVTLLAVGYGAYVVLNDPPDHNFNQFTSEPNQGTSASDGDLPAVEIETAETPARETSPGVVSLPTLPDTPTAPNLIQQVPSEQLQGGYADYPSYPANQPDTVVSTESDSSVPGLVPPVPSNATESRFAEGSTATSRFEVPSAQITSEQQSLPSNDVSATDTVALPPPDTINIDQPSPDNSLGPLPPGGNMQGAGSSSFEQAWQTVQQHLQHDDLVPALSVLSAWYNEPTLSGEQRSRCLGLLDQLAGTVIYSRAHLLEPAYAVQAGETLDEIAARYNLPAGLLAKINGIAPPYALVTGETLKVLRGPFRAEVRLGDGHLAMFLGQHYAGRFPVRIGRDLPAQEASYDVAEKNNGRSYFDRQLGREILKGETGNRYGDHWLGLRGDQITAGHSVGIHGRPNSPPDAEIGSISLDPVDAEDVFSIMSIGSRVQVRR